MKLNLSVNDLFNHMLVLGLAQIVEEEMPEAGHVTICWPDPQTSEIGWLDGGDLSINEAAEAVWSFKEKVLSHIGPNGGEAPIDRTIQIRGAKGVRDCSPLSPRIANKPAFTEAVWSSYFGVRNEILDSMDEVSPLFVRLVRALGFPSYWSELSSIRSIQGNLDIGASSWEMAPRNSGSEFFTNKYIPLLKGIMKSLDAGDIAKHVQGICSDARGTDRNASGLHRPSPTDSCRSWIAYHGLALFSVRPVTQGSCVSVSQGLLSLGGNTEFVLPIPTKPITIGSYAAASRFDGIYLLASGSSGGQDAARSRAQDVSWFAAHGIAYIIEFTRFKGGSASCPEYFALEGHVSALEDKA
jgi:hypothetical protein